MARELKKIPVADQAEAARIINQLCEKYNMKQDVTRIQFHASNEHYAAYYDTLEGVVKMEAIHTGVTEEQIEEFLINFPPFF
jgi:hypothetical protein